MDLVRVFHGHDQNPTLLLTLSCQESDLVLGPQNTWTTDPEDEDSIPTVSGTTRLSALMRRLDEPLPTR